MEKSFDENSLRLSLAGGPSSSSDHEQESKDSVGSQDQQETKKRSLGLFKLAMEMHAKNWLSLAPPKSAPLSSIPPMEIEETASIDISTDLLCPRNRKQKRKPPSSKKPESYEIIDNMKKLKLLRKSIAGELSPNTNMQVETRWRQNADEMGLIRQELYLTKIVTKSDAEPNQNRLQLAQSDINKTQPMKELAERVLESDGEIFVKVLDAKGNKYSMAFKYLKTSKTYRFMGRDYSKFLASSQLREKQKLEIWMLLPRDGNEIDADIWLGFINSDQVDKET